MFILLPEPVKKVEKGECQIGVNCLVKRPIEGDMMLNIGEASIFGLVYLYLFNNLNFINIYKAATSVSAESIKL